MTALQSWFKGILIETDWVQAPTDLTARADFFNRTQRALIKISTYPLGADLLNLIRKRHEGTGTSASGDKRTVTIRMAKTGAEGADTQAWEIHNRFNTEKQFGGRTIKFAGKGSRTIVYYHNHAESDAIYTRLATVQTPAWIALAHELIHAFHHLSGTTYKDSAEGVGGTAKREEMFTTGLGPYANTRISENALRREANLPVRTFYTYPNDHSYINSLAPAFDPERLGRGFWYCQCIRDHFG
jgi:hypothetical protein